MFEKLRQQSGIVYRFSVGKNAAENVHFSYYDMLQKILQKVSSISCHKDSKIRASHVGTICQKLNRNRAYIWDILFGNNY